MTINFKYVYNRSSIFIGGCYDTVKRNLILDKQFNDKNLITSHKCIEQSFKLEENKKFFLPMPPPNITGKLHLGHSLFLTIQDSIIRFKKSCGYDTLWLPGTDHAGISMYEKIIEQMPNKQFSEQEFFTTAWQWKDRYENEIIQQIKALNPALNWEYQRFTLDKDYQNSSIAALTLCEDILFYKEGQWFLDMSDAAQQLLQAIECGEIEIIPASEKGQLTHFLKNIQPWCISRQILWGQRMPIYMSSTGNYAIASSEQEAREKLQGDIWQIQDRFDTWFNSSLWPFATLGWPEKTALYEKYYSADLIETGDDILFFWCARMLMMGKICTGIYPFKKIYLHGLIRDSKGQKMSKSLGNGIDPLEIINDFGSDNLRWTLITNTTAGHDIKFDKQQLHATKKFLNKLWQAGRFFEFNKIPSKFIYKESNYLSQLKKEFENSMQNYDFQNASRNLQNFFKHSFCDKWIEENKKEIQNKNMDIYFEGLSIYLDILKMFYIFIPSIAEHLFFILMQE